MTLALMLLLGQGAWAQDVTYVERVWNEETRTLTTTTKTCSQYKDMADISDNQGWRGVGDAYGEEFKWVVVRSDVSMKTLNVQGEAHLILCDGATLTCSEGVRLIAGNKLYVYSQHEADTDEAQGKLVANQAENNNAAIGGTKTNAFGALYVHGGIIEANGPSKYGAGIGHGATRSSNSSSSLSGGEMHVYGGKITAKGGNSSAGIGGSSGYENVSACHGINYYQYGGTVYAEGGELAAGLGGGGGYERFIFNSNGSGGGVGNTYIYGGTLEAKGGEDGPGIGNGNNYGKGENNLLTGTWVKIFGGNVTATGKGERAAGIGGGRGDRPLGVWLSIEGGIVHATGATDGPGIGAYKESHVWIKGGEVWAIGMGEGAGIGGSENGVGGETHIWGGTVMAIAGIDCIGEKDGKGCAIGPGRGISSKDSNSPLGIASSLEIGSATEAPDFYPCVFAGLTSSDGTYHTPIGHVSACRWHNYAKITACQHNQSADALSYSVVNDKKHLKSCKFCGLKVEEEHSYNNEDKCVCGKAGQTPVTTWTVTVYEAAITGDRTYDGGEEILVHKGEKLTLPDPVENEDYDFVGWLVNPDLISNFIIAGTDLKDVKAPGEQVEVTADMKIYARYAYSYDQALWTWSADCTKAEVKVKKSQSEEWEFLTATVTGPKKTIEDGITVKTYTATVETELNGYSYTFEDEAELYEMDELELKENDDNDGLLSEYDGMKVDKVVLKDRTLYQDGTWNTLCLPFNVPDISGTCLNWADLDLRTLESSQYDAATGTLTLNFTEATSIVAGRPYIIRSKAIHPNGNLSDFDFMNVTISYDYQPVTTDYVSFMGTYSPVEMEGGDTEVLYLGAANQLYWPQTDVTLGSCRAAFVLDIDNDISVNAIQLSFDGEGETTGISPSPTLPQGEGAWYSLDGRKLQAAPTQKGLYIHNGKKVVIK